MGFDLLGLDVVSRVEDGGRAQRDGDARGAGLRPGELDPLVYKYYCTAGTVVPGGSGARWTAPASPGSVQLSVEVSDGHGNTARRSLAVLVKTPPPPPVVPPANYPPRIISFRSEPSEPRNDGLSVLRLTVEAQDDNGAADLAWARFQAR